MFASSTTSPSHQHQSPVTSPVILKEPPKWEINDVNLTALKTVISRSTSPSCDPKKQLRTRIARTTDPIVVEHRRSRKPRVVDASCQTDVIPEYGSLADYLNPPVVKPKTPEPTKVEVM